ncbi:MAG: biotin--[acetyl-CoA-carboxylase] ligase [Actinomycetota bacterium]|nr:biotin--[acetyl-CoA-carboxylase] ligase [Actinomycetota bacterium]
MLNPGARLALAGTRFTDVRHMATVESTNGAVAALARQGAPEGVVVVADHQTAGRGRRGRTWDAPAGSSLLVSVLLRPPAADAHLAGMATALAAVQACAEVAGVAVALKWPNDLVLGDRKLGGILGEVVTAGDRAAVVVGLGLNVDWDAPLPPGAIDLRSATGAVVDRAKLLVALLRALEERCRQPAARILTEYRSRCVTLGRPVRVELGRLAVSGTATAVDEQGRLVVDAGRERRVIAAGEVIHLR